MNRCSIYVCWINKWANNNCRHRKSIHCKTVWQNVFYWLAALRWPNTVYLSWSFNCFHSEPCFTLLEWITGGWVCKWILEVTESLRKRLWGSELIASPHFCFLCSHRLLAFHLCRHPYLLWLTCELHVTYSICMWTSAMSITGQGRMWNQVCLELETEAFGARGAEQSPAWFKQCDVQRDSRACSKLYATESQP